MAHVSEARRFTIDPHAIMSLIRAQSGSLQKAMLEAVANSMDAGATRIDVSLSADRVEIRDNGAGLTKDQEIYDFFERFGFDHSQLDRKVGRFGVGRGQLFCFGVNTWRTNGFEMCIDIKNRGLDYDLKKGMPRQPGMAIAIDLDEKLSVAEQLGVEEEFRQLVKFCTVPVFFNGQRVSEDPAQAKWSFETEDAWFYVRKDGRLSVYSQGLFVKDLWGHEYGVGGRIVTKPGRALEQNLARNDLLVKDCPVWKRVKPVITKLAKPYRDKAMTDTVITTDMRRTMARSALTEDGAQDLLRGKLFTLTNNKHVDLSKLLSSGYVAHADMLDRSADKLMQRKQAMVVDPSTLERFGVDSVAQLHGKLTKAMAVLDKRARKSHGLVGGVYAHHVQVLHETLARTQFFESVHDLPFDTDTSFEVVPYAKLRDEEKAVGNALRKQMGVIAFKVSGRWGSKDRKLEFFEGDDTTEACTNGATTVWINRKVMMKKASKGVAGFMELMGLLVHEQIHDENSQLSHGHPPEFYEKFHDLLLDGDVARHGLSAFALSLRHGHKPTARRLSQLEAAGVEVDMDVGTGQAFLEEEGPDAAAAAAAAKPRRARKRA